jgi:hypothetical protein
LDPTFNGCVWSVPNDEFNSDEGAEWGSVLAEFFNQLKNPM